jgi:hypothetical protein
LIPARFEDQTFPCHADAWNGSFVRPQSDEQLFDGDHRPAVLALIQLHLEEAVIAETPRLDAIANRVG